MVQQESLKFTELLPCARDWSDGFIWIMLLNIPSKVSAIISFTDETEA